MTLTQTSTKLIKKLQNLPNWGIFLTFSLVAIFIRFPFFFRDYIDQDESTFILVAQSWVEGHLPYTELWDLKPPIVFLFFALIIKVFGKSFIAIRLFGSLLVAGTAFASFSIAKKMQSISLGLWVGFGTVFLLSLFGSVQGVMSEHISTIFFMMALALLIKSRTKDSKYASETNFSTQDHSQSVKSGKENIWYYLGAGILMGLAFLSKLNLGYAIFFLGLFLLFPFKQTSSGHKNYLRAIGNFTVYSLGIFLPIVLFTLVYYQAGLLSLFYKSIIIAPIEYMHIERGPILKVLPLGIIIILLLVFTWKKLLANYLKKDILIIIISIAAILASFFRVGKINGHYLIQLYPLLLLLIGLYVSKTTFISKIKLSPAWIFLLVLIPVESYKEYIDVAKNKIEKGQFFNGEGVDVPLYLKAHNLEQKNIFFSDYHIGYWLLNTKPPTKSTTHPSNMYREELFSCYGNTRTTALEELKYIFEEKKPTIYIRRKPRNKKPGQAKTIYEIRFQEEIDYFKATLKNNYVLLDRVGEAEIYQRL